MRAPLGLVLILALAGCGNEEPSHHTMIEVLEIPQSPGKEQQILIAEESVWEYHDGGVDLGSDWRLSPPESEWRRGKAPLGYGESYVDTVVSFGRDLTRKHPTTYYRKAFEVVDPAQLEKLYVRAMFDDGFVLYLNGREVGRAWMPAGPVTYETLSPGYETGCSYMIFDISAHLPDLIAGRNTLAVEVHQDSPLSSDQTMDMALVGIAPSARELSLAANRSLRRD